MDFISPVYALFLMQSVAAAEVQEAMLLDTGLTREDLESGANISMEAFQKLLLNADRLCDDHIGKIIGTRAGVLTLGTVGSAAAAAPSIREGFQIINAFTRLHASYAKGEVFSSHQGLRLSFEFSDKISVTERFHAESVLFMMQNYLQMVLGFKMHDGVYMVRHQPPAYADLYQQWFASPVLFGEESIAVVVPKQYLDRHSPFYNREVWEQALQLLSQQIEELGEQNQSSYSYHVKSLLRSCDTPLPGLAFVAGRLHVSERTLNRRLQQEGHTFRELKVAVVLERAREYLRETSLSVEAIAGALGYQDVANFRRSFRSVEGCSPGEYRRVCAGQR
ncbi:MAG: ornithine utilization transcriptional regulator OruR [Candidatus Pelagadaptatus aseana]|uniref:AraC family transcriptional regulator n=1 Tax=Candidatus Pelagadaptatus aseana TaxID=3120508 RepID=UPI0039B2E4F8